MARINDSKKVNMVGKNVRKLRKANNWSQQELSVRLELLGVYVCRGSISRIEDMSRTVTDIELFALAKVFKVSVDELFDK